MLPQVKSEPYPWPFDGRWSPADTALMIIDMQVDFCKPGGYVDAMGLGVELTGAPIMPTRRVLEAARTYGLHIIHTREGHRPDLADLNPNKRWRSARTGAEIGQPGPCGRILTRGEPGWEIVPELTPLPGEPVIDKPGKGAFYATDLDQILHRLGIRNLIFTGVTTDCCVHTTMRDANDRGYECMLLSDCCAATEVANHEAVLTFTQMGHGLFGTVAPSEALLDVLEKQSVPA
ncbi:MAG: cysteine hydrolase [Rhodospirillaceae bacterium]|nr:cysteine hydrolase [Rhodospirillaceae bacterium]